MRIISGKHKGRRIELAKEAAGIVRPTSDFAREAVFNILLHSAHGLADHSFAGKRVLDLFCGSGALGLEALSRGAAEAMFIDQAREAMQSVRANAERMKESETVECLLADAGRLGRARKRYDVIFLDPPYFSGLIGKALASLQAGGWIADDALLVAEHDAKETIELPAGFSIIDERRYGRAVVNLLMLEDA